ncbi:MAG: c-type cytochrome [Prochlorococcaceae cyanobacterium]|jgi:cytochrome c6
MKPLARLGSGLARLGLALALLLTLLLPVRGAWALGETAADGAALFEQHCAGCHVNGGNIIRRGKTLRLATLQRNGIADAQAVATIIQAGLGQMGSYAAAVGEEGIEPLAAYVWQQAEAGWPRAA